MTAQRLRGTLTNSAAMRWLLPLGLAGVAGAAATSTQFPLILAAAFCLVAGALAVLGIALPPGWVIVVLLFVLAPLGALLRELDTAGFVLVSALGALVPFVVATVVANPWTVRRILLLAPLGALALLAAASTQWSPAPQAGMDKLVLWALTGAVPAGFMVVLASVSRHVGWTAIVAGAAATGVATLLFADSSVYPPTLFETNPIWASRGAFLGALVTLFVPFPLLLKLVTVPVLVLAGYSTASLGPLLGFGAGVVAGWVESLRHETRPRRSAVGWLGLTLGVGSVTIILVSGVADPLLASVYDDPNVAARARYLDQSWQQFLTAPLTGIGLGGFAALGEHDYPHNLPAEIALEVGFLGILLFLAWTVLAFRAAAGSPVLVALVSATLVFTLFSGSLGSNSEFWLCSALAVATSAWLRRREGSLAQDRS